MDSNLKVAAIMAFVFFTIGMVRVLYRLDVILSLLKKHETGKPEDADGDSFRSQIRRK